MAGNSDPSRTGRVIGLLPAGSIPIISGLTAGGFARLVRVAGGYEAAAELLGGPASALLVDLAMLTNGHGPLLKLAAGLSVPVVAFGMVSSSLDGSVLAGVHLVGAEQAAEALRELIAGTASAVAVDEPAAAAPSAAEKSLGQFDGAHRGQFGKPLTREEIDALLSG